MAEHMQAGGPRSLLDNGPEAVLFACYCPDVPDGVEVAVVGDCDGLHWWGVGLALARHGRVWCLPARRADLCAPNMAVWDDTQAGCRARAVFATARQVRLELCNVLSDAAIILTNMAHVRLSTHQHSSPFVFATQT